MSKPNRPKAATPSFLTGEQRINKLLAAAGFGSRRQVDELITDGRVEIDGKLSVFFHPDDEVRPGLPTAPEALAEGVANTPPAASPVCCGRCGYTVVHGLAPSACPHCEHDGWVPAISLVRVA